MKLRNLVLLGIIALAFGGCARQRLSVHTEYLTYERLASYHVDTPDPRKCNPELGQRICIDWYLPKCYLNYEDLHLHIMVRMRDRKTDEVNVPIDNSIGSYCYYLLNDEYFNSCGILTYKVELIGCGEILDTWCHQLWVDLINCCEEPATGDDVYQTPDGDFDDEVWDWK